MKIHYTSNAFLKSIFQKLSKNPAIQIFLIAIIIRLAILPFSQTVNGDAVSRILIGIEWIKEGVISYYSTWGPIHIYLNGFFVWLSGGERVIIPKLFHILAISLVAFPFYYFTKREFNSKGAYFATLLFLLNPISIRLSLQAMSMPFFILFVALSLNYLSKAIKNNHTTSKYIFLSGLFLTISSGIRFEGWLITGLFVLILILRYRFKLIIPFLTTALIFPVIWMISCHIHTGDFLYSMHSTMSINAILLDPDNTAIKGFQRLLFFPYSLFLVTTPLVFLITVGFCIYLIVNNQFNKHLHVWIFTTFLFMMVFVSKAGDFSLATQHRYTLTISLFFTPFFALLFTKNAYPKIKKWIGCLLVITIIPLSCLYPKIRFDKLFSSSSMYKHVVEKLVKSPDNTGIYPIPRLSEYEKNHKLEKIINNNITEKDGVILDWLDWQSFFYQALRANVTGDHLFLTHFNPDKNIDTASLEHFVKKFNNGILIINKDGFLYNKCKTDNRILTIKGISHSFLIKEIDQVKAYGVFEYKVIPHNQMDHYYSINKGKAPLDFFYTKKDIEYYINKIHESDEWLEGIKKDAEERGIELDVLVRGNAKYMVEQDSIKAAQEQQNQ